MANGAIGSGEENRLAAAGKSAQRLALGRRLWVAFHRWAGIVPGAVFVLMGLSGSILAFREPIDEWLNARIMRVEAPPGGSYRPLSEILASAKASVPPAAMAERLKMPRHRGAAAAVTFIAISDDLETDVIEVFINPYTARPTGQRLLQQGDKLLSKPFIHLLMDFHWTLLLGYDRAYLIGTAAIFIFFSVLAGLYLWWPRSGGWRQALTIKWGATPGRITYDLHKTVGFYLSAALAVLLFSGIYMIFKPQVRSAVALFSPVRQEPVDLKSIPVSGRAPISLDEAAMIADKVFPDGRLHWILIPSGPEGVYAVGKQAESEPNRSSSYRNVTIDQYNGQILHVQDRAKFTAGETFLEWQYPIHCGEAFGNPGRAFVMFMGFVPLTLYVTGFLRWRQKRRARNQ
ncbi:MAG TPA: PepSY-associated TM helix domain-containing protein [Methylocella sp.]|nr:PepSY-associated TM helix domain-containing protein [Methylocella sp.]